MKRLKIALKRSRQRIQPAICLGTLGTLVLSSSLFASSLERLSASATTAQSLIKGPIGTSVLLAATVGGAATSLMKGNMWLAIAILVIGVLLGFHIDNINNIFVAQQ